MGSLCSFAHACIKKTSKQFFNRVRVETNLIRLRTLCKLSCRQLFIFIFFCILILLACIILLLGKGHSPRGAVRFSEKILTKIHYANEYWYIIIYQCNNWNDFSTRIFIFKRHSVFYQTIYFSQQSLDSKLLVK